ncbi:MAG: hypothetical protein V1495_10885 [Pseudomonadota bacterium]
MRKLTGLTLVLGVLLITGASFASSPTPLFSHNEFSVGKGDLQTQFGLDSHILKGDAKATIIQLRLGANYFVTDILAPGAEVWILHPDAGNYIRFQPNLKAYWPTHKRFMPYALVGLGYLHTPASDLFDFALGPGIDYMVSDTVAIGIMFRYDLAAGDGTIHDIQFPLGFNIYFKI